MPKYGVSVVIAMETPYPFGVSTVLGLITAGSSRSGRRAHSPQDC
jgi:hypothetical protein